MMRLDKYLADMGDQTRSEVKKQIRKGSVTVNGKVVKAPECKVEGDGQDICVDGVPVTYASFEYYMLNKPSGVVSAVKDKRDKTVVDLIESKKRKDLFPVGRLDKDTEGLLLITNDGALAHQLLSPKKHVDKVYLAKVDEEVTAEDVTCFEKGLNIGSEEKPEWCRPAKLEILSGGTPSHIRLTIQEGKFHQVKRMFQAVDKTVLYLKRQSMGSLVLDEALEAGAYRPLEKEELFALCAAKEDESGE